jgi:hypothetical protein
MPMKFSMALGGLLCLGLTSGTGYAVTAGTNSPAKPAAVAPADDTAPDANADATATAEQDQNPYTAIMRANIFHLTEPPKPQPKDDPAILNLPTVKMTGFRRRDGEPIRALFATVPKDPKEPARYFNLSEGEKEDILEIKRIDPNQEFVDVIIAGTPTTLTVKSNSFVQPIIIPKNGVNPATANPGLVAHMPQPMAPPLAAPTPNQNAYNYNQGNSGVIVGGAGSAPANPGVAVTTIGGNNSQLGNAAYGGNPAGAAAGNPGDSSARTIPGSVPVPTRGIRASNYTPNQYQPQSLDEARVHAAVYHEMNQPAIEAGEAPPAPPFQQ